MVQVFDSIIVFKDTDCAHNPNFLVSPLILILIFLFLLSCFMSA